MLPKAGVIESWIFDGHHELESAKGPTEFGALTCLAIRTYPENRAPRIPASRVLPVLLQFPKGVINCTPTG